MKVIIIQKAGKDYPKPCEGKPLFYENQKRNIRQALHLRATDQVEITESII